MPDKAGHAVLRHLAESNQDSTLGASPQAYRQEQNILKTEKLDEPEQKAADFVRNVIAPNSSAIDPPDPEGSIALAKALTDILEKVAYGDYTAQEAAEEYYRQEQDLWGE